MNIIFRSNVIHPFYLAYRPQGSFYYLYNHLLHSMTKTIDKKAIEMLESRYAFSTFASQ
jgi:hypothetical protein